MGACCSHALRMVGYYLEDKMKKLALAAVLAGTATAASAGSYAEPVIEAPVIVEETSSSSVGIVLPLIAIAVIAAVLAD